MQDCGRAATTDVSPAFQGWAPLPACLPKDTNNGKIERWHTTLKEDCIRPQVPLSLDDARRPIDFGAVRSIISIGAVLQLLGFRAQSAYRGQQRGPCPLHGSTSSTTRGFSANEQEHVFQCFKCGRSGNALDLWAMLQNSLPTMRLLTCAADSTCRCPIRPCPMRTATGKRNPHLAYRHHLYNDDA